MVMGRGRVDDQKNKLFLSRIIHINIHFCCINDFSYMIHKLDFQLTNSNIIQLRHRIKLRQPLLQPSTPGLVLGRPRELGYPCCTRSQAHRTRICLFQSLLSFVFFFGSVYRHNGSADYRTTVVPIILAIRTTVVPIIFTNRMTVDRTINAWAKRKFERVPTIYMLNQVINFFGRANNYCNSHDCRSDNIDNRHDRRADNI